MLKYIFLTLLGSAASRTEDRPRDPLLETAEAGAVGVAQGYVLGLVVCVMIVVGLFIVGSILGYR
jgi:hypothetical protein